MNKKDEYVKTTDCLVFFKYANHEWIPNFEEGTIYSNRLGRNLKGRRSKEGYQYLRLSCGGITKTVGVHRALWVMKNGIPLDPKLQIDHINHNPADNRLSNLRLLTVSENHRNRPEKFEQAEAIRAEYEAGVSMGALAEQYQYSRRMIEHIIAKECYDPAAYPGTEVKQYLHLNPYGGEILRWNR